MCQKFHPMPQIKPVTRVRVLRRNFKISINWSILLRIAIIACFQNWNNQFASTHVIGIEIWALSQKIFTLQFPRLSPKFWKIVDFKSAISPLLELQMRWFFFWNCVFLKEKFRYAIYFFWFCAESFRNWSESRRPKKKKFPLVPRKVLWYQMWGPCSKQVIKTQDIAAELKIKFILIAGHLEGATYFEQAQYKITSRCLPWPQHTLIYQK